MKEEPNACRYSEIPLREPEMQYARLQSLLLVVGRTFLGHIRFENTTSTPVVRIAFLVEYFDSEGKSLFSVVYATQTTAYSIHDVDPFLGEVAEQLKAPIGPGQTHDVQGYSPMTSSRCPASSELKFLSLTYADGSRARWSAPQWRSGPVLYDSPLFFPIPCGHLTPGFSSLIAMQVDSKGRVKNISSREALDAVTMQCLSGHLTQWIFYPALQTGTPTESTIDILFRVDSLNTDWSPATPEVRQALVAVDVVPQREVPGKWVVYYGIQPTSRTAVVISSKPRRHKAD